MRSLGWAQIQDDCCPYKKGRGLLWWSMLPMQGTWVQSLVGELRFPRAARLSQKTKTKTEGEIVTSINTKEDPVKTQRSWLSRSGQGSRLAQTFGVHVSYPLQVPGSWLVLRVFSLSLTPPGTGINSSSDQAPLKNRHTLESGKWLKTWLGWVWVGCSPFGKKSKDKLPCIQKPLGVLVLDTSPVG